MLSIVPSLLKREKKKEEERELLGILFEQDPIPTSRVVIICIHFSQYIFSSRKAFPCSTFLLTLKIIMRDCCIGMY